MRIARHTPTLTGQKVVRALLVDSALLSHFGEAITDLTYPHTWKTVDDPIDDITTAAFETVDSWYGLLMIGSIGQFLGAVPAYYLPLDGATHLIADYPELAAVLDAQYVDETGGQFTLPDTAGLVLMHHDAAGAVGDVGGEVEHILTEAEMPSHTHTYTHPVAAVDIGSVGPPVPAVPTTTPGTPTGTAGAGDPHENRPPFIAVTFGIFAGRIHV